MENTVMLAADLYQRLYNSPATDGGALEVAGAVIEEACRMEAWLTEKYGEDDDQYLDRLEEYESLLMEKYGLEEKPKQTVWVFVANQASDGEEFDTITDVFTTEEAARKHLHEFVHGDEGEYEYATKRGWKIQHDDPDYFQACEDGYYCTNHTEATIEKKEVK